ncbi:hypothetical protein P4S60_05275 [Pseudoalteromonas sp. Hal040]|uniref:hypothetical protein n=1 Tax=unclassified Pseudoalteromonas TaxID=194690 RepID=UPI00301D7274
MSKLFKLKEWLTLNETVDYISKSLNEPVTIPDLFRLALDKHIVISVNLVNGAQACLGKFISKADISLITFTKDIIGEELEQPYIAPENGESYFEDDKFIKIDNTKIQNISGVWDLTLAGSEAIDLEFYCQKMTSGLEVTLVGLEGVYLEKNGVLAQLHTSFDLNEYMEGSKIYCQKAEDSLDKSNMTSDEIDDFRNDLKEKRRKFLSRDQFAKSNYYPSGGLDEHDYDFVFRTSEINRFLSSLEVGDKDESEQSVELKLRTPEQSLIDSLGLMALLLSKKSTIYERANKPNSYQIKEAIQTLVDDLGIDQNENKLLISNLDRDITTAYRHLIKKYKI